MADELKFSVSLEDRISGAAERSSASLKKMSTALNDAKVKLAFYQQQLRRANDLGDIEAHGRLTEQVRKTKDAVFALAEAVGPQFPQPKTEPIARGIFRIVEPVEIARHSIESLGRGFREMGTALKAGEASGVIRGMTESISGLVSSLDILIPGLGQVASAAVKVGGAFAAATVGVAQFAVETALEVRSVNDRLKATFDALGTQGPESGAKTEAMLNRLSLALPQTREQLADYTKTFEGMGITDLGQLRAQIMATASAQAIMGDQGAEAFEHMSRKIRLAVEAGKGLKLGERPLEQLYKMGTNATDVAGRLGLTVNQLRMRLEAGTINATAFGNALESSLLDKGQEPLAAMSRSWDVLKRKGFEIFQHLFDDIDTRPLTDAIQMVLSLGDQGEPSGHAMRKGITAGVNGIIKILGEATIQGTAFFLHLEAKAIRLETRLRPLTHFLERVLWLLGKIDIGAAAVDLAGSAPGPLGAIVNAARLAAGAADIGTMPTRSTAGATAHWKAIQAGTAAPDVEKPSKGILAQVVQTVLAIAAPNAAHALHVGQILIQAPEGVTDAQSLSVTGIGTALERLQLMGAR